LKRRRHFTSRDKTMFEKARLISGATNVCRYDAAFSISLAAGSSISAYAGSSLDLRMCY